MLFHVKLFKLTGALECLTKVQCRYTSSVFPLLHEFNDRSQSHCDLTHQEGSQVLDPLKPRGAQTCSQPRAVGGFCGGRDREAALERGDSAVTGGAGGRRKTPRLGAKFRFWEKGKRNRAVPRRPARRGGTAGEGRRSPHI